MSAKLKVGYLGPEGTYSHAAAIRRFGSDADLVPSIVPRIADVFDMLHHGLIQRGVVPIENSTEGAVRATLDSFVSYIPIIQGPGLGITITEELLMDINLNLLSTATNINTVKTIYAHEQAIAQSRNWLFNIVPDATTVAVGSNALAARKAAGDPSAAAIASADAADIYKLKIIAPNIQGSVGNTTRFVVLGGKQPQPTGDDKTSLLVSTPHKPGALLSILKPLAQKGVNMTHLESRPSGGRNWEYTFFIEVEGHRDAEPLKGALVELEPIFRDGGLLLILGSYPVAATQAADG